MARLPYLAVTLLLLVTPVADCTYHGDICPNPCLLFDDVPKCHTFKSPRNKVVICYSGMDQWSMDAILKAWSTTHVTIEPPKEGVEIVTGSNYSEVSKLLEGSLWDMFYPTIFPETSSRRIPTFETTCVGLKSTKSMIEKVCVVEIVRFRHLFLLLTGIGLFFVAPRLCRNVPLQYSAGTLLGVCGSVLILIFILSKLVPGKKYGAYAFLTFGWSTAAYFASLMLANLTEWIASYWHWITLYVLLSGIVSFAYCYWVGPVTSERSLSIIQWTLQTVSLLLIYLSFQPEVLSVSVGVMIVSVYNCPSFVKRWFAIKSYMLFPPKKKLLTSEEYKVEGIKETAKALKELREYCKTNEDYNSVSRLKSSRKFMRFLDGEYHISSDEIVAYEREYSSEDDLDSSDISESSDN